MRLIDDLERARAAEESYFRRYLLGEDIARLKQLVERAPGNCDRQAFVEAGSALHWTADGRRDHELRETLLPLLAAVHARLATGEMGVGMGEAMAVSEFERLDDEVATRWAAFDRDRIDRLVGCLSRVPQPNG